LSEIFFEEYGFKSLLRTHTGDLTCYQNKLENEEEKCCLVIESGYSFTHIVPYVLGKRVREAVKRIDVGGKLLTNHLKEIISYRQLHVLEETYVMNACKEDCCFVTTEWSSDIKKAQLRGKENLVARDYVLPDFTTIRRGFMKTQEKSTGKPSDGEQIIRMNNERFMVPEVLFNPQDIGIQQMGIPESVQLAISCCEPNVQPWLYRNIVLTGGNVMFPGFKQRLENEIRALAPDDMEVKIRVSTDPIEYPWKGGSSIAQDSDFSKLCVSKAEYNERGFNACLNKYYL